jgi:hypothetical protein
MSFKTVDVGKLSELYLYLFQPQKVLIGIFILFKIRRVGWDGDFYPPGAHQEHEGLRLPLEIKVGNNNSQN